jgi:uncharacterized tellurite resistance protein B-like protein
MTAADDPDIETELLTELRRFFESRGGAAGESAERVTEGRLQLATTVIFLQMIAADHGTKHDEHEVLLNAVARVLGLNGDDALMLIRLAEAHVKTPLPKLLRLLDNDCTIAQKKKVVESMWRLAFADAELAGHEEYFVRKVAQALGLNTADLVETKVLAKDAFLGTN